MQSLAPASQREPQRRWWWHFDPRLSLRARVTLGAGGCALAFALLAGWTATGLLRRSLASRATDALGFLAFQASGTFDRSVQERLRELQFAASLDPIRRPSTDNLPALRSVLDGLQSSSPKLAWAGLLALDGQIVASTDRQLDDVPLSDRPWLRTARQRPVVGGVREDPGLAHTLVNTGPETPRFLELAVPVTGANDEPAGVLAGKVRWDPDREMQPPLETESAARRFAVTLYSGAGDVLLESGRTGWTEPPPPPALPEAHRFRGAVIEADADGAKYVSGYARSRGPGNREPGWLTVVRQPLDEVLAPVVALRRSLVIAGGLWVTAAMIAAWCISARLARRLRAIAAAARRIREGDILAVMPLPHSNDEYGRMCSALGAMVEELRARKRGNEGP